jgi:hypothetical protein
MTWNVHNRLCGLVAYVGILCLTLASGVADARPDPSACDGHPATYSYTCGGYQFTVTICSSSFKIEQCVPWQTAPHIVIYDGWVVVEGAIPPWPIVGTPDTIIGGVEGDDGIKSAKDAQDAADAGREWKPLANAVRVRACLAVLSHGIDAACWRDVPGPTTPDAERLFIKGRLLNFSRAGMTRGKVVVSKKRTSDNELKRLTQTAAPLLDDPAQYDQQMRDFMPLARTEAGPR